MKAYPGYGYLGVVELQAGAVERAAIRAHEAFVCGSLPRYNSALRDVESHIADLQAQLVKMREDMANV